jgi:aryl-alcohol dehydrogenase-like predicted oxidoreductase
MKTRTLGPDLEVAEIGLGCMTMTGGYGGSPDRSAMVNLIRTRQPWIVPIPGTTKPHRLTENIGAADVDLSAADVDRLTALSDSVEIVGGRYPDFLEEQTNR